MIPARIYMRFPGELSKAVTLSYDDGTVHDIKMVEILNKYGIKCTFNVSAGLFPDEYKRDKDGTLHGRIPRKDCVEIYKGHEVAVHAYAHPVLTQEPIARVTLELLADRVVLEQEFETAIRGMALPFGDISYSPEVEGAMKASGIVYSRMTSPTRKFDLPSNWLCWHPTCKHMDEKLVELTEKFVNAKASRDPELFYLWGHSFEFNNNNDWEILENFCQSVGNRDDIWYATNIEIYDYVQAYERLVWTADMTRVYNPSVIPVSFMHQTITKSGDVFKKYTVGAGETVCVL